MRHPSEVLLTNDQPGQLKPQEHFLQGKGMEAKELGSLPPPPHCFLFSPHSQNLPDFLRATNSPLPLKFDLFIISKAIRFVTAQKAPLG